MKVEKLVQRLEAFKRTWLSNPAAQRDFAVLVQDVHDCPTFDHADEALLDWIQEERACAKRLGIR